MDSEPNLLDDHVLPAEACWAAVDGQDWFGFGFVVPQDQMDCDLLAGEWLSAEDFLLVVKPKGSSYLKNWF